MGSRAQRHPGRVGIIYLEMNIMQLSLKTNSRVFCFVFLLLILTTHLWNTASQWSFFVQHKAEQMLAQVPATWQAIVALAGTSRLGNLRKTFHPSWRQDYDSGNRCETQGLLRASLGMAWESWGFTSVRYQHQEPAGKLWAKVVMPAGKILQFNCSAGRTALVNKKSLGKLEYTLPQPCL